MAPEGHRPRSRRLQPFSLWRSGAVIHGPVARDYSFKINKQVRKLALKMALSSRYTSENLLVVDKLQFDEIKTKNFVACKDTLGLKKP